MNTPDSHGSGLRGSQIDATMRHDAGTQCPLCKSWPSSQAHCHVSVCPMKPAAPKWNADPVRLHDQLGAMIDQVGHPDYSLRELVDGLRKVRDDLLHISLPAAPAGVVVPRELLIDLVRYGRIAPVDGVCYERSHRACMDEATKLLADAPTLPCVAEVSSEVKK